MFDMPSEKKKSTNQLVKIVMLAHCEQLPARVIWKCMWNEGEKADVNAVKIRRSVKAITL